MGCVIGIDGGTESIRVHVFDLTGNCKAATSHSYSTQFAVGGRAEQNPDDWWQAVGSAVREAVKSAGIASHEVDALAIATTCCSVVALDRNANPLRPAILWMDLRAAAEAAAVLATTDQALQVNCAGEGPVSAEWMIPKALWIARNEPEIFSRAATICEFQDYMNIRLTGRLCASLNNTTVRWHYSAERDGYPVSLLEKLHLEPLLQKWPREVLAPGEVIGTLTAEAAKHLGLGSHVKVIQGGADAFIGMPGLGVSQPGQIALITGSSHLTLGVSDCPISAKGLWGSYPDAVYPGRHIIEGGQTSTGSIVNWLRRVAGTNFDVVTLNHEAAKLEPGCDGLLVLDHFQGNRTPHVDALSRGAFIGLSLNHGLPHLFRAVIEGICFGTKTILDQMVAAGFDVREIVIGGGATASELWLQIHADTTGLPIHVPRVSVAPAFGAAILAGVGAGHFASIDVGIESMVRPGKMIEPRPANVARYKELFQSYVALYPALKPLIQASSKASAMSQPQIGSQ